MRCRRKSTDTLATVLRKNRRISHLASSVLDFNFPRQITTAVEENRVWLSGTESEAAILEATDFIVSVADELPCIVLKLDGFVVLSFRGPPEGNLTLDIDLSMTEIGSVIVTSVGSEVNPWTLAVKPSSNGRSSQKVELVAGTHFIPQQQTVLHIKSESPLVYNLSIVDIRLLRGEGDDQVDMLRDIDPPVCGNCERRWDGIADRP